MVSFSNWMLSFFAPGSKTTRPQGFLSRRNHKTFLEKTMEESAPPFKWQTIAKGQA